MGKIWDWITGNQGLIGSIINGATNSAALGYQISKDKHLTGAEQEANAFSAQQADLSRQFEAQQADIARDWQEQQYLQYNSPQAMIRQYQDAGLNPALMYQSAGGSPASVNTSIPSSSMVSSVHPQGAGNIMEMVANLSLLHAQMENIKADTKLKSSQSGLVGSQTTSQNITNNWLDAQKRLEIESVSQSIQESIQRSKVLGSEVIVNGQMAVKLNDESDKLIADTFLANLTSDKLRVEINYMSDLYRAQIDLMDSQSGSERAKAAELWSQEALNAVEHLKENKLLSSGYYDRMVDNISYVTKKLKADINHQITVDELLSKDSDWYEVNKTFGLINSLTNSFSNVARGLSPFIPSETSFVGSGGEFTGAIVNRRNF